MAKATLGSMVSSVNGSVGGVVVSTGAKGTVLRRKPVYRRPTSPAQAEAEARMRAASAVWSSMTAAQAAQWRAWGEGRGRTAQTAFVGLATKYLQVNGGSTVPLAPPSHDFIEDDVAISASSPLAPTPLPQRGEGNGILFAATGPNRAGSATELLIQPLLNERRSPGKDYKTAAFTVLAGASPSYLLPTAPGSYAVGYRFVELATGQQGPVRLLGVVRVG